MPRAPFITEASMSAKNTAVFGIYPTYQSLETAVDVLRSSGFRNTDISFLTAENVGSKDLGLMKASKAPEGVMFGAGAGAVLGGALGWFTADLVVAGPIVAALAGVGALGMTGGFIGGLIGMGLPEYEANRYEGRVRKGGILLSVHCDDSAWIRRAREILGRTAAENIAAADEAPADFARTDKPIPRTGAIDQEKLWLKRDV
jgi:hypothetical protein